MERLKKMNLKRAFFVLYSGGVIASMCLRLLLFMCCEKVRDNYPSGGIEFRADGTNVLLQQPTKEQERILRMIDGFQFFACILLPAGGIPSDCPITVVMTVAVDQGVDAEEIIMEQKSVSTEENLMFSKKLIDNENAKVVIVTTAYHVFRTLILAKQQGIKCVGFGAKTKWYFTLNALLREFAGYFRLTWKRHAIVIGIIIFVAAAFR